MTAAGCRKEEKARLAAKEEAARMRRKRDEALPCHSTGISCATRMSSCMWVIYLQDHGRSLQFSKEGAYIVCYNDSLGGEFANPSRCKQPAPCRNNLRVPLD